MKFKKYINETTAPTTGIIKFHDIIMKYSGVENVVIDDWVDYDTSTAYTIFVELKNYGKSKAAMNPRKAGILIDKTINIVKLKNNIKKEAKKLGLIIRSIDSPKKKKETSTFMGKKESYYIGYNTNVFEIDMVENKPLIKKKQLSIF